MPKPVMRTDLVARQEYVRQPWVFKGYYQEHYAVAAFKLCLLGCTIADLAAFFEVTEMTIHNWKKKFPAFNDAIVRGKTLADSEVVHSLYQRAIGYNHPEEVIQYDRVEGRFVRTETTKHYPPDTTAAMKWLNNRRPRDWQDRVAITDKDGNNIGPITLNITGV